MDDLIKALMEEKEDTNNKESNEDDDDSELEDRNSVLEVSMVAIDTGSEPLDTNTFNTRRTSATRRSRMVVKGHHQ